MFTNPFYFSLIRKYTILCGTLFNNIHITRNDKDGNQSALLRVPIMYAPKDKMLARVIQDPGLDRPSATAPLPLISFELGKMSYDGSRKLNTVGQVVVKDPENPNVMKQQYNPVPYNIDFKVYIYAKNTEDGTKIIEQILPYFTPDWTTTVELIPEMNISMDVPIILNNIGYEDTYAGDFTDRRAIIWSLDLTLKGYLYGPVKKSGIIKFINTNYFTPTVADGKLSTAVGATPIAEKVTIQPGLTANGEPINYYGQYTTNLGTLPYTEIDADDNFGHITMVQPLVGGIGTEYALLTDTSSNQLTADEDSPIYIYIIPT